MTANGGEFGVPNATKDDPGGDEIRRKVIVLIVLVEVGEEMVVGVPWEGKAEPCAQQRTWQREALGSGVVGKPEKRGCSAVASTPRADGCVD